MQQNETPSEKIELALALASGKTITAVAEQTGVARSTIHRQLADPGFRQLVAELRAQLIAAALGHLADNMTQATRALVALLDEADPGVRLRAARAVLSLGLRLRDSVELSDRIRDVEEELARKQGGLP